LKVMITGIGVTLKSSLGRRIHELVPKSTRLDLDYGTAEEYYELLEKEQKDSGTFLIFESVHGLEEKMHTYEQGCPQVSNDPASYDLIICLLPPKNHTILWLNRAWEWFRSGRVDLVKGNRKKYSLQNLPLIFKQVSYDLWNRRRWVKEDIERIANLRKQGANIVVARGLGNALQSFHKWFKGAEAEM